MGMMTDVAVKEAVKAADKAAGAGRAVLAYRQNVPLTKSGWSGEINPIGEVIEAIESRGWRLDHMAFDGMQSSHGGCILLFRRDCPQWQQQPAYGQSGLGQLVRDDDWRQR